jgi:flagellar biosynthesis protein FliR
MSQLAQLLLSEVGLLILSCTRLTGMLLAAPLGWDMAPVRIRGALVIVTALAIHGIHPESTTATVGTVLGWVIMALGEFLLGLAIGFVVRIAISIAEIAAESFTPIMGLGAAQIFDPHSASTSSVLTRVFRYFAILLALSLGVHRIILGAILHSFRVLPVGSIDTPHGAAEPLLAMVALAIGSGVRIAIPILALLFMTQAALAFISRAAPAMQIFSVGFAVTLAVGAAATILAFPDMGRQLALELSYVGRHIEQVARSMSSTVP